MITNMRVAFIILLTFAACSRAADIDVLIKAIHQVESSRRINPPDGDHGKAIGPFQIHYSYWSDAVHFDKSLASSGYQACRDYAYARRVVIAYLRRFGARYIASGNVEALARIHNGGPNGYHDRVTMAYWRKIRKAGV